MLPGSGHTEKSGLTRLAHAFCWNSPGDMRYVLTVNGERAIGIVLVGVGAVKRFVKTTLADTALHEPHAACMSVICLEPGLLV